MCSWGKNPYQVNGEDIAKIELRIWPRPQAVKSDKEKCKMYSNRHLGL